MQAPTNHKRSAAAAERLFQRPLHACYACNDTGIVTNSDGLVNEFLPDYDRLPDGRRMSGRDLALICHCPAAFPGQGPNGPRTGFREGDGRLRLVDGRHAFGAELPEAITTCLDQRRRASWRQSERDMNASRRAREAGQADARPWFLVELRAAMEEQAKQALRAGAAASGDGFQSIGSCLQQVVGGAGGILEAVDPPVTGGEGPAPPPEQAAPSTSTENGDELRGDADAAAVATSAAAQALLAQTVPPHT
jgi:hypothetical protein